MLLNEGGGAAAAAAGKHREIDSMEIKNYVHEHPLKLVCERNSDGQLLCPGCGDPSFGESYSCITCDLYPYTCFACDRDLSGGGCVYICEHCWPQTPLLHQSCADLPEEIQITHRPGCFFIFNKQSNHSEKLYCDFCFQRHREFRYYCEGCDFQIGVGCASKLIHYHQQQHIKHFSHRHPLTSFRFDHDIINCNLCLKNIHHESCYGCAPCEFYIHNSCRQFLQEIMHPFHPGHFLTLDFDIKSTAGRESLCDACCFHIRGFKYRCEEDNHCTFNLHPECTSLKPTIKHNGHHQHLLVVVENRSYRSKCESCGFSTLGNFFIRCVECRLNYHLHCGSRRRIPPRVLLEQHQHPLIPAIAEKDDSPHHDQELLLYCNVCSGERNPEDPFYRCAVECDYSAHIRCAITEVQYRGEGKLKHFMHEHILILRDQMLDEDGEICCYGCEKLVESPGYGCDICPFYLHRSCAELPRQIYGHQMHTHYLVLQVSCASPFPCNSCDKEPYGFMYECKSCDFYLDLDCASKHPSINLTDDQCESYDEDRIGHFSHQHYLTTTVLEIDGVKCNLCYKKIEGGQSYGCAPCGYYIHISCGELSQETRHPFHPLHYLTLMMLDEQQSSCYACRLQIQGLTYRCDECNIDLHPECLSSEGNIKYEGHDQHLLTRVEKMSYQFQCNACSLTIEGTFFMRCAECNFDFHEQCGPLPLPPPTVLDGRPLTAIVQVQADKREKIRHFSHEHFLFAGPENNNIVQCCCACEEKIGKDKPSYGCDMCMFYLHKSCVDLPTERHHPFHRRPLYLQGRYWGGYRQCKGCFKFYRGFSYCCQVCDFNLDLECSSFDDSSSENLKSIHKRCRIITMKHKSVHDEQQHRLTLFTKLYVTPECNCCKFIPPDKLTPLDSFFVRCFDCKFFNRHFLCCPLPKTIQVDDFHPHPLTLENNFINLFDGFDDREFCCDVCETRRDARECVYYCEECSFVADLECLLLEVMHILKQDPEADTLRIPRKENISQVSSEKCSTYKQMLESLTEEEKKSIKQVENEIKQGSLLYFFEELKGVNQLVKARITKVLSDNNIDEDVLKSMAMEVAQGKMQLTFIDDDEAELVDVHGYKINGELAAILKKLVDKYGDMGASCPLTQSLKTMLLIPLCWVLQRMKNTKVMDINGWLIIHWWFILKLVEIAGIRVDFALNHLKRIAAVFFLIDSSKSSPLYKLHQDMAQVSREIYEMNAKVGKLEEKFQKLNKEARDKIFAHGEGSRSHARLLNDTLAEGLWWEYVTTGLLDDII